MSIAVSTLIGKVKSAIDELVEQDSQISQDIDDAGNLTQVILDKVGYALQFVLEYAAADKLDDSVFGGLTQTEMQLFTIDNLTKKARLVLPSNVLRIVSARLSSWSQSPTPESDTSDVYLMQQNQYTKGSYDRPVSILTAAGEDRYLEMYSAKETSDTLVISVIRMPASTYTDNDSVTVPTLLEAALVYQIAGLTLTAFKDDAAEKFFALARQYMGWTNE